MVYFPPLLFLNQKPAADPPMLKRDLQSFRGVNFLGGLSLTELIPAWSGTVEGRGLLRVVLFVSCPGEGGNRGGGSCWRMENPERGPAPLPAASLGVFGAGGRRMRGWLVPRCRRGRG